MDAPVRARFEEPIGSRRSSGDVLEEGDKGAVRDGRRFRRHERFNVERVALSSLSAPAAFTEMTDVVRVRAGRVEVHAVSRMLDRVEPGVRVLLRRRVAGREGLNEWCGSERKVGGCTVEGEGEDERRTSADDVHCD